MPLTCEVEGCGHVEEMPMRMGVHRKRAHGIAGKGGHYKKAGSRDRGDRAPRGRPPSAPRTPKPGKYAPALEAYAGMVGMAFSAAAMARQNPQLAYDGAVIMEGAHEWAMAWERLAAQDPKVARVLDMLVSTSQWTEVAAATAGIVVPILACHRVVPAEAASLFGVAPPPDRPPPPPTPENEESNGVRTASGPLAEHFDPDATTPTGTPSFVG